jgi:hypothetical protein
MQALASSYCGQEPALFYGAPGERREFVDQPAGAPAWMPAMFVTGQGRPVHEHPRIHANPLRRDAQRARTRGALLFGYFLLGTQEKVTRAARRADRKLLLFASSEQASKRRSLKLSKSKEPSSEAWQGPERTLRPAPSPTYLRFARALGVIGCHRQPMSDPEPLPGGRGAGSGDRSDDGQRPAHGGPGPTP